MSQDHWSNIAFQSAIHKNIQMALATKITNLLTLNL